MDQNYFDYIWPILLAFGLAWVMRVIFSRLVRRFINVSDRAPDLLRLRQERKRTLHDLITSAFTVLVYIIAFFFSLSLFIETTTIIWMIGLFSAAFGIGANTLIRDFLTGLSFIFEDTVDVGDKVEIMEIQGVVERINLRTMFLRATTGELYVIPNGEVRVIRNFSRGIFSTLEVAIRVRTHQLEQALPMIEELGKEAQIQLPTIIEPWQVITTSTTVANETELSLLVRTKYGKAAETRPRLMNFLQTRLTELGLELAAS